MSSGWAKRTAPLIVVLALLFGCGRVGVELLAVDGSFEPSDGNGDGGAPDAEVPDAGCPVTCANQHGSAECSTGACELTCANGYEDCDGDTANGCETSTADSDASCGECGSACVNPGGTTSCVAGVCAPTCSPTAADCDDDPRNGCETDLMSVMTCGDCDVACTNEHGTTSCGTMGCVPVCSAGYRDCDDDATNGCETQTSSDPANCGGCGVRCNPETQICVAGSCEISPCSPGRAECDQDPAVACEVDTTNDVANCGFCANRCTVANGTPRCVSSSCGVASCNTGFGNCDSSLTNGCETAFNTSTAHCSRCNNPCTNAHGTTSCVGGACVPMCTTGWGSCDGNPQNGCETALDSVAHCGACGRACTVSEPNATPICTGGVCGRVCGSMSGVYGLKLTVPVTWSDTQYIASGTGTMVFWARLALGQSGTTLNGTMTLCGRVVPATRNDVVSESYAPVFPDATFERSLPVVNVTGTLGGTAPGASFALQRNVLYMGVSMSDPLNGSWPSLSQINAPDHDGDGSRGVTMNYRNDGGYRYPPTSGSFFANRASRGYIGERVVFSLGGTLSSCTQAAGGASAERFDTHTVGCRRDSGSQCSSSEYGHIDSNTPDFSPRPASYTLTRLGNTGATITCGQVRSALP